MKGDWDMDWASFVVGILIGMLAGGPLALMALCRLCGLDRLPGNYNP